MKNFDFDQQQIAGSLCEYYEPRVVQARPTKAQDTIWRCGYPIPRTVANPELITDSLQKVRFAA